MSTTGNAVTDPVTNATRTHDVTLPHTTPHHTTPLSTGLGLGTSLRASNGLQATTITLLILRPDWPEGDTAAVLARDPRPWRTVVAAALACALDPAIEHPSRIETTNAPAIAAAGPTPVPPSLADVRREAARRTADDCGHGDIRERCALCRHHRPAEELA
ncbi:MAG: hypothetical protein AB7H92_18380 [Microbacteriaceae bacterium]